jgi:hypothetical protein
LQLVRSRKIIPDAVSSKPVVTSTMSSASAAPAFDQLVESGKLLLGVPRRDVRKWARYIDREVSMRAGATRIGVIREHIAALDSKSGPMTAIAGVLVAIAAVAGNSLFTSNIDQQAAILLFFPFAALTGICVVYSISALGMEMPEDAAAGDNAAFEYRLLQRLIYRARNHAWGLRSAQGAGAYASLAIGFLVGKPDALT